MKMVKLMVKADYRNREVAYPAGTEIEVPENEAEFLLRDAPGCFEIAPAARGKAVKGPAVDKMVREGEAEDKALESGEDEVPDEVGSEDEAAE